MDDVEASTHMKGGNAVELKTTGASSTDATGGKLSKPSKDETRKFSRNRDSISHKDTVIREQSRQSTSSSSPAKTNMASVRISLLDDGNSESTSSSGGQSSGLSSTWLSMKTGLQNTKANIGAKKFLPLQEGLETKLVSPSSSSESVDEIFQRLKRPTLDHAAYNDEDDDMEIQKLGPSR